MKKFEHPDLLEGIDPAELARKRVARAIIYFEEHHPAEWQEFLVSDPDDSLIRIDIQHGTAGFVLLPLFPKRREQIPCDITWTPAKFWAIARSLGLTGHDVERMGLYVCPRFGELTDKTPTPEILATAWREAILARQKQQCHTPEEVPILEAA